MAVIELKDIRKVYPLGKQKVEAIKGVSFGIEKGEFAAISGPSGSGKSTLLNMIGLIDLPTSGEIIIDGINVYDGFDLGSTRIESDRLNNYVEKKSRLEKKIKNTVPAKIDRRITGLRRSHIGFIFQTFNLIPVLNVYENIEFPLLLESKQKELACPVDSFTKKEKQEWIQFLMEKVGLSDWEKHKPSELSGGQRQRVAIARALVTKAPLILADEPTANLDSVNSAQILTLMKDLNKDPDLQTTFIFSTHDKRIVDMCDHVVHIFDGLVKEDEHKSGSDIYEVASK
ncbi:MAG: ABC transporter ATP-binding protein [Treponema sp.]|nr:ABC transporter ATP-binding protein [Treponema sp.]